MGHKKTSRTVSCAAIEFLSSSEPRLQTKNRINFCPITVRGRKPLFTNCMFLALRSLSIVSTLFTLSLSNIFRFDIRWRPKLNPAEALQDVLAR